MPIRADSSLWDAIEASCSPKYNTWVLLDNVPRCLALTQFWQALEDGKIFLSMPRHFECDELGRLTKNNGLQSCFVFNQNSTIITCSFLSGKRFVVLDFANFDRSKRTKTESGQDRVNYMEKFFLSLIRLGKEIGGGKLRYTLAGMAYSMFRANMEDHRIYSHNLKEARELERASYFGGQTSRYWSGSYSNRVYHLDVRSLFPFVMRDLAVPTKLIEYFGNINCHPDELNLDYSNLIAEVTVNDKSRIFPKRIDEKPVYCTGRFRTVLSGPELSAGTRTGSVERIHAFSRYECRGVFRSFVQRLWDLRLEAERMGDEKASKLLKILMNSLYGKFAQLGGDMVLLPKIYAGKQWGRWVVPATNRYPRREFNCLNWKAFEIVDRVELERSIPAISSFITSAARVYMNKLKEIAGWDNVFYQATDSLIVNVEGFKNLESAGTINPSKLGKLQIKEAAEFIALYSTNFYRFGDELTFSGLKKEAVRVGDSMFSQIVSPSMRTSAFVGPNQQCQESFVFLFSEKASGILKDCEGRRIQPTVLKEN